VFDTIFRSGTDLISLIILFLFLLGRPLQKTKGSILIALGLATNSITDRATCGKVWQKSLWRCGSQNTMLFFIIFTAVDCSFLRKCKCNII